MEADEARKLAYATMSNLSAPTDEHWIIRLFLTSSRSFKYAVARNIHMDSTIKELLISHSMPKFVWIAELSSKELQLKNLACGMILMDATQPKPRREAVLVYFDENHYMDTTNHTSRGINISPGHFSIYSNNLTTF